MRQAIVTKYLGPTNYRGSRIKASAQAGTMTIPWDHALNADENHKRAAVALLEKLDWPGAFVGGALPDGTGYAFVLIGNRLTGKSHE